MTESARDEEAPSGLERIVFFSDAVIAIAITLLVLEIKLPPMPENADNAALVEALFSVGPKISAYVVSFLVVGMFWYAHHLRFRFIRRYDLRLIWLNMLFLMAIGFVPFATAVHSEHVLPAAAAVYDGTMAVVALLSAAVWGYAIRRDRLVSPGLDPRIRRQSLVSPLLLAGIFIGAGIVAQFDPPTGHWVLLLLIPAALSGAGRKKRR
jgi:uncharacterized membrane protein